MNSKASLMAALVGLAMLATPIAASAKDHRDDYVRAQSRFVGPAIVTKHDLRNASRATWMPAPVGVHPVREWHDHGYRGYGYRGYSTPPYTPLRRRFMPPRPIQPPCTAVMAPPTQIRAVTRAAS